MAFSQHAGMRLAERPVVRDQPAPVVEYVERQRRGQLVIDGGPALEGQRDGRGDPGRHEQWKARERRGRGDVRVTAPDVQCHQVRAGQPVDLRRVGGP